jgi:hypothetical protein
MLKKLAHSRSTSSPTWPRCGHSTGTISTVRSKGVAVRLYRVRSIPTMYRSLVGKYQGNTGTYSTNPHGVSVHTRQVPMEYRYILDKSAWSTPYRYILDKSAWSTAWRPETRPGTRPETRPGTRPGPIDHRGKLRRYRPAYIEQVFSLAP